MNYSNNTKQPLKDMDSYPVAIVGDRPRMESQLIAAMYNMPELFADYTINPKTDLMTEDGKFFYSLGLYMYKQGYRSFEEVEVDTVAESDKRIKDNLAKHGGYRDFDEIRHIIDNSNADAYYDAVVRSNTLCRLYDAGYPVERDKDKLAGLTADQICDYYERGVTDIRPASSPTRGISSIAPMSEYMDTFRRMCQERKPRLSTGYKAVDKVLGGGMTNELYIMAAETSTGKSAFMMSLAQNIAESGNADVLYFTIEMSRAEFVWRGVSTISHCKHLEDPAAKQYTVQELRSGIEDDDDYSYLPYEAYEAYLAEYIKRYGEHLYIIESGLIGGVSAAKIYSLVRAHKARTNRPCVVFVDYLQLLAPNDATVRGDRKDRIDQAVTTLKSLAAQEDVPVFIASSIQRAGYGSRVGASAYKESGDTEYTGGILLGWNWDGVTDESDPDRKLDEEIAANRRGYRNITLEVLKNRNGERNNVVHFLHYPAYHYFEVSEDKGKSRNNGSIWR